MHRRAPLRLRARERKGKHPPARSRGGEEGRQGRAGVDRRGRPPLDGEEKKEQDLLTDPTVLADPARITEVAVAVQGLVEFKAWLRANFTCETFTTPDDLGRKIAVAL